MRTLKWHIYNSETPSKPLCWGHAALEFDTKEDAVNFWESLPKTKENLEARIEQDILYYPSGSVNVSGKILGYDEHGEEILVEVNK